MKYQILQRIKQERQNISRRTCLPGLPLDWLYLPGKLLERSWTPGQLLDSWTATGQVLDKSEKLLGRSGQQTDSGFLNKFCTFWFHMLRFYETDLHHLIWIWSKTILNIRKHMLYQNMIRRNTKTNKYRRRIS